jgi:hypothetical protein
MSNLEITRNVSVTEIVEANGVVVEVVSPGPQGPPGSGAGSTTFVGLTDVDAANRVNGSVVVYDATAAKFKVDDLTTILTLTDGGAF